MHKILAISGSLRKASSNTALLNAAALLEEENVDIQVYAELGALPLFNPDLEGFEPRSVLDFRKYLRDADGVLIASPEYAHGVTGALKNALDWVVGSGELSGKPVALLNAAPRAIHAHASLKETLITMDARFIHEASLVIPLPHNKIDKAGILAHPALKQELQRSLRIFISSIKAC